jgi:hypothetical protein
MSHHAQVGCMTNLDPAFMRIQVIQHPHEEPLQARSIHHCNVRQDTHTQLHTPQAAAYQAKAHLRLACDDGEVLQDGALFDEEGQVVVLHQHEAEEKLPEVGEAGFARELGGVRQPPGAEVQVGDGGAAEDCGGEKEVQRPWAVEKDELFFKP